jgi:hypothetical protein
VTFRRAAGDEESRTAFKILRARFLHFVQDRLFAEFTLSGRARFFAPLRMTSEVLGMTVERRFSQSLNRRCDEEDGFVEENFD